jgi:hypothetical protein
MTIVSSMRRRVGAVDEVELEPDSGLRVPRLSTKRPSCQWAAPVPVLVCRRSFLPVDPARLVAVIATTAAG